MAARKVRLFIGCSIYFLLLPKIIFFWVIFKFLPSRIIYSCKTFEIKAAKISRFIWTEYAELLQCDDPEREYGIFQYLKRCTESDPKRKFVSLHNFRCLFLSATFSFSNQSFSEKYFLTYHVIFLHFSKNLPV